MRNYFYEIVRTAEEKFGITAIKPYQILIIHRLLEQDYENIEKINQLVILPTGTGKSLCFLLPALLCSGITIIVYPLLALLNDQIVKLKKSNITFACLRGGQTFKQRKAEIQKLRNGAKILLTTPETLCQEKTKSLLCGLKVSLFVCDECHVVSLWGSTFRPAYKELKKAVEKIKPVQIVAFTATADEKVINDVEEVLFKQKPLIVKGDSDRENIIYRAFPSNDRLFSVNELVKNCEKPAIVFCPTRDLCRKVCWQCKIRNKNIPMRYYHAGLSKNERQSLENWFMGQNEGVLFATNAYGMGIDKRNIRTIIHYKVPESVLSYLQESGRAGRDGEMAVSWVVVANDGTESGPVSKIFRDENCRRQALLKELGQDKQYCTGCDFCMNKIIKEPFENEAIRKVVKRSPLQYSVETLAYLLTGSNSLHLINSAQKQNPFYGVLRNHDSLLLQRAIKAMCGKNGILREVKLRRKVLILRHKQAVCDKIICGYEENKKSEKQKVPDSDYFALCSSIPDFQIPWISEL